MSAPSSSPPNAQTPPEHDPPPRAHPPAVLPSPHILTQAHPERDIGTRPSKRQRTPQHAHMAAGRASPSSDSSSQSGMADNETEVEPGQQSEHSTRQVPAPPKKKRTRTLTTPHQSTVLHALLAKSRFPTTAMREEVGRQIGLSPRKVQIWFQNQRQKARRPQSESAPLSRPPQFGPFPIATTAGPSYPSPPAGGPTSEVSPSGPGSARSAGSLDSNSPLSGPGMPSWSSSSHQRRHSSAEERERPRDVPLGSSLHQLASRSSDDGSRTSTHGPALQPAAQATQVETSPHLSRVLPPITLSPLEPRCSAEPCGSTTSPFPPPPSLTFVNAVQCHESSARPVTEPGSGPSLAIPPPFALQPQPQWDPQTFAPFTRPEFASWSHLPRSVRSSFTAVGAHDSSPRSRCFNTSSGEPRRSGQLDPPLPHHIIPSSRGERHSTSASSRASVSGQGHAGSDKPVGEV